jgi:selenocysteine-specific translation elongation factor
MKICSSSHTFTITFETKKLGILLNGNLEIASVMNNTLEKTLKIGDTLVAINGSRVGNASLEEVQKRLMNLPRPVKITFSRAIVAIDDDSQGDKSIASVVDLTQDDSPPVARLRAVETTQTSASSASRLASQPSQPSTGSQISAEVYSPNLL